MSSPHAAHKALIAPLRRAQYDWDDAALHAALARIAVPETVFRLAHPFGDLTGAKAFCDRALGHLRRAWPDVERRDWIVIAGETPEGAEWVGCAGQFVGTFARPFLDIPPTGHLAHMRFHEFYRIEDGRLTEMQAIWDIPEVMLQAGAWPMAPSLGREICVPGPASGDGLDPGPRDAAQSRQSRDLVVEMLTHMVRHPAQGGPEVMEMPRFWSERMTWYGPAGIGTARGIAGFRHWHQIPFLAAMPDRSLARAGTAHHFFAENAYVAVTGWPNMAQTLTGDGWLGIAPTGREITLRSLDFWRIEAGRIRENWVLLDLLDAFRQLGVDVFQRLRTFNLARVPGAVPFPVGAA